MADNVLLEYTKQVYTLESELYTLNQMREATNNGIMMNQNSIKKEECNGYFSDLSGGYDRSFLSFLGGIPLLLIGVYFIVVLIYGIILHDTSGWWLVLLLGLGSLWAGIYLTYFKYFRDVFFKIKVKKEKKNRIAAEIEKIHNKNMECQDNIEKLNDTKAKLNGYISEKEKALKTIYDYNIIHPSYRNFYGISKIYHLLDTGICEELTGINGAYSQMRLDQIIDNQRINIGIQQQILESNHMLYRAVANTNMLLGDIKNQNANSIEQLRDLNRSVDISNFLQESANDDLRALAQSASYLEYAQRNM